MASFHGHTGGRSGSMPLTRRGISLPTFPTSGRSQERYRHVLAASWAILKYYHTGRNQPVKFTVIRRDADIDCLQYRLRVHLDCDSTVMSFLQEFHGAMNEAGNMEHDDITQSPVEQHPNLHDDYESFRSVLVFHSAASPRATTVFDSPVWSLAFHFVHANGSSGNHILFGEFDGRLHQKEWVELVLNDLAYVAAQVIDVYQSSLESRLKYLDLVSPFSKRKVLRLNGIPAPKVEHCVQQVFSNQASQNPYGLAVHSWDGEITYSELDEQSDLAAGYLRELGIRPRDVVPLLVDRSKLAVIWIIAVLKAGGTLCLLDPGLPDSRLNAMVSDSGARLIIARKKIPWDLPPGIQQHVVDDTVLQQLEPTTLRSEYSLGAPIPDDPLYVVFTSGSTGRPKGVVVSHTSFLTSSEGFKEAIMIEEPGRRVLQYSSFAFDISILEILTTLTTGGCICIPTHTDRLNDLSQCIRDMKVNWAMLTPSVIRQLKPNDVPDLQVLCAVGEELTPDLVDLWAHKVKFINGYGPAEAAILAVVSGPLSKGEKRVPLGRPRNCRVWIVDADNSETVKLLPLGSIGEMLIEGNTLARNYLRDEEKTQRSFGIMSDILGSLNMDGTIDFFGRMDTQIKIHGQRAEIGDIEYHIRKFLSDIAVQGDTLTLDHHSYTPADLEISVELLKLRDGFARLAVFTALNDRVSYSEGNQKILVDRDQDLYRWILDITDSMAAHLSQSLPSYMIPRVVLPCWYIPKTHSGKIDRTALRNIGTAMTVHELYQTGRSSPSQDTQYQSGTETAETNSSVQTLLSELSHYSGLQQRRSLDSADSSENLDHSLTTTESKLRGVWATVLHQPEERISPEDDFFKLGGDSITAIQVVAASREVGLSVTVAIILTQKTLRKVACMCKETTLPVQDQPTGPFSLLPKYDVARIQLETASLCAVGVEDIEDIYPATHTQKSLMIANALRPGSLMGQFVFRPPRDVDLARFKAAWATAYALTPMLRTRLVITSSAAALQVVVKERGLCWRTAEGLESYMEQDRKEQMLPGMDMARFALVGDTNAMSFVLTLHHGLYDRWFVDILYRRVNNLYHGQTPKPQHDFRRFVRFTQKQDSALCLEFWNEQLEGFRGKLLPGIAKVGQNPVARANVKGFLKFPPWREGQVSGVTKATILRLAWAAVLAHFARSDDVVFEETLSGRSAAMEGIENVDGPTAVTVPIRIKLEESDRLIHLMHRIQGQYASMIPFEQTPMDTIRDSSHDAKIACTFQSLLVIQSQWSDLQIGPLRDPEHEGELTQWPLVCELHIRDSGVDILLDIDESQVDRDLDLELIRSFESIAGTLLELPECSPMTLAGLLDVVWQTRDDEDDAEETCNSGDIEVINISTPDLIMEASRRHLGKEALICAQTFVSFRDLERFSSSLALYLVSRGVQRGDILPLYFEKSTWAVVAMLGTLKAGAAFVMLDPNQPFSRLQSIISHTRGDIGLASFHLARHLEIARKFETVLVVDDNLFHTLPVTLTLELPVVSPDGIAYVMFTSGSTGQPKGIFISHSAISSSSVAYGKSLGLTAGRRVFQFSSFSFDACINEIITTLIFGATVCMPTEEERLSDLAQTMRRMKVDWAILTPSVARLLSPEEIPQLKTLDLGGEAPDSQLLSTWFRSGVEVFNVYGPAEAACTATSQRYREGLNPHTIGTPMGCCAWVVDPDDHHRLVSDGEIGELVLGGPNLAHGYLNDRAKTESAFVSDVGWAKGNLNTNVWARRVYKTGDLVYRGRENGLLVYVGRQDWRVKINGQRFELGEIEANLSTNDMVKRCVVLFPGSGPLKEQLSVVIEPVEQSDNAINLNSASFNDLAGRLKNELTSKIPAAVIPIHWMSSHSLSFADGGFLPLSSSGKIDRRRILNFIEGLSQTEADNLLNLGKSQLESLVLVLGGQDTIPITEYPAYSIAKKIYSLAAPSSRTVDPDLTNTAETGEHALRDIKLSDSGLDSLKMMSLLVFISQTFRINVSMQLLLHPNTSIRSLAAHITQQQSGDLNEPDRPQNGSGNGGSVEHVNVLANIEHYDSQIVSAKNNCGTSSSPVVDSMSPTYKLTEKEPNTVFLTGATGFIGTQILRQLLEDDQQVKRVTVLVRASSISQARLRVIETAKKARWWSPFHGERLDVWSGDLSQERLGLDNSQWNLLQSGQVADVIIHNGATVHFGKSYEALKAVNVHSTVQLRSLVLSNPMMRLVYVTGGREWSGEEAPEHEMAAELSTSDPIGYEQTKFVSEALVKRAAQRKKAGSNQLAIINPGLVVGTRTEGVANADDYLWRLASASIRIGAYNADDKDIWVRVSEVAETARTVVDMALRPVLPTCLMTSILDGMTWGEFYGILSTTMGYKLEAVSGEEWTKRVQSDFDRSEPESHPMWPFAHELGNEASQEEKLQGEGWRRLGKTPATLRAAVMRSAMYLRESGMLLGVVGSEESI
ncbi:Nonribosomal peptide synthase atnA [Naviculisporaceae sp. PSN 640]